MLKVLFPLIVMFAVLLPIQGDAACAWILWLTIETETFSDEKGGGEQNGV